MKEMTQGVGGTRSVSPPTQNGWTVRVRYDKKDQVYKKGVLKVSWRGSLMSLELSS